MHWLKVLRNSEEPGRQISLLFFYSPLCKIMYFKTICAHMQFRKILIQIAFFWMSQYFLVSVFLSLIPSLLSVRDLLESSFWFIPLLKILYWHFDLKSPWQGFFLRPFIIWSRLSLQYHLPPLWFSPGPGAKLDYLEFLLILCMFS